MWGILHVVYTDLTFPNPLNLEKILLRAADQHCKACSASLFTAACVDDLVRLTLKTLHSLTIVHKLQRTAAIAQC